MAGSKGTRLKPNQLVAPTDFVNYRCGFLDSLLSFAETMKSVNLIPHLGLKELTMKQLRAGNPERTKPEQ